MQSTSSHEENSAYHATRLGYVSNYRVQSYTLYIIRKRNISRLAGFWGHFSEKSKKKNPFIICSFDRKYLPLQSINKPFILKTKFKIAK